MPTPILATKLYIPQPRPKLVHRARLLERLNGGLQRKFTLISAPAGFGKTTLVSEWVAGVARPTAWLAVDEGDNDPKRFLACLVAALQTLTLSSQTGQAVPIGKGLLALLQSAQPPPLETVLTTLLNELHTVVDPFILVLDDYHLIDTPAVDEALAFLLDHLPPPLHLVMTTRADPPFPLARLRARAQLTEVRAADLRFTLDEAIDFLNDVMGLDLAADDIAALEARTEGWIAGLQLAAVSMQGHLATGTGGQHDISTFIESFTGSHRFVMDYLVEEVLQQQPEPLQRFLLQSSILKRLCGPLCDALLADPSVEGQKTLEALDQANLFIVPLDNERRWYRYHHLFAELLRQRLQQRAASSTDDTLDVAIYHRRASQWYEENALPLEAFEHATAANDIGRAERLIEGEGMPLHFRGAIRPVLNWLQTLPTTVLDAHPSLWLAYASTLLATGQVARTEEVLQAADQLLQCQEEDTAPTEEVRDLIGRIAAIRATIAAGRQQSDLIIAHSEKALAYLHADNLAFRTSTNWKLGYVYHLNGDFAAAKQAYQAVVSRGERSGNTIFTIMSYTGLAIIYHIESQLTKAVTHYQRALDLFGEQPLPIASEAYIGLARIYYEWNDLDRARHHADTFLTLVRQDEKRAGLPLAELLLAHLALTEGDLTERASPFAQLTTIVQQAQSNYHLDALLARQVVTLRTQEQIADAIALAEPHDLPLTKARLYLSQGEISKAMDTLEAAQQTAISQKRTGKLISVMALQALAYQRSGQREQAIALLGETVALAAPSGLRRLFVDEGLPMARLLQALKPKVADHDATVAYIDGLLALFDLTEGQAVAAESNGEATDSSETAGDQPLIEPLIEPLSEREIEILDLIAAGHKNQEIADQLHISLNTVRYHTKNLFGKLGVNRRTQAVAKAQALQLI